MYTVLGCEGGAVDFTTVHWRLVQASLPLPLDDPDETWLTDAAMEAVYLLIDPFFCSVNGHS